MGDGARGETPLFANEFVEVQCDEQRRLIRVTRTSHPIAALNDVELAWGSVTRVLVTVDKRRTGLLMDMRRARGRNDDAFERAVAKHRAATVSGFARVAVLVESLHGKLQVQRHVREDELAEVRVFDAEPQAVTWLLEEGAGKAG